MAFVLHHRIVPLICYVNNLMEQLIWLGRTLVVSVGTRSNHIINAREINKLATNISKIGFVNRIELYKLAGIQSHGRTMGACFMNFFPGTCIAGRKTRHISYMLDSQLGVTNCSDSQMRSISRSVVFRAFLLMPAFIFNIFPRLRRETVGKMEYKNICNLHFLVESGNLDGLWIGHCLLPDNTHFMPYWSSTSIT